MSDGGPAFPVPNDANVNDQMGMLLRDWFAGQAMQGMYAGHACTTDGDMGNYARAAYAIADAMLAERKSSTEEARR